MVEANARIGPRRSNTFPEAVELLEKLVHDAPQVSECGDNLEVVRAHLAKLRRHPDKLP
jgi:hypothetical protein